MERKLSLPQLELQSFGIQVSVFEPGAVNTEFFNTLSKNSDEKMKNIKSPYMDRYQNDMNYRKKQKRADIGKAAVDIYNKLNKKKLKARYLITVPPIYNLLIVLPGGLREKTMLLFSR